MEIIDYVILAVFGALGAFISGFLGVGGGIIYIPVLDYFLKKAGMNDTMLVKGILANSLFTIIFSGSVSSYNQYKHGNFFPKQILQTATISLKIDVHHRTCSKCLMHSAVSSILGLHLPHAQACQTSIIMGRSNSSTAKNPSKQQ